ncbi:non-ribosomal peptide synthetase [Achromobacter sp. Bel]|uniref:non-ribosomal peptide synthetase n=1 Tax=Achromobacter sp. Bel TaxID=2727415 RepID=UPI00145C549F|nr:non-ribosomal peptide synthetase [Achromobacter sp. Bel]NMK49940.1 amino acid adenylation domain-containing protein [Achromobacter sp. Bel]
MQASEISATTLPATIVARVRDLARNRPEDTALTVVDATGERRFTYAALDARVRALAAVLAGAYAVNDRALLLMDNNEHYVTGFFACMYAGLIPVPVFPPESVRRQQLARVATIATDCAARCVLTTADLRDAIAPFEDLWAGADMLAIDGELAVPGAHDAEFEPDGEQIAFLQYTSGSTSAPKGVMVSHANLMANEAAIAERLGANPGDVWVSWLPLYHDMGLIGGLLQPLYRGIPCVLMSPRYFLERPMRWPEAVAAYGGTHSGGPDFSYRLCLERAKPERLAQLDLSRWRVAFSGAEPVRHDTLRDFLATFAPARLATGAVYPCYGLAEATLLVTGGVSGGGMTATGFDPALLAAGQVSPAPQGGKLVACGTVPSHHAVRIVDPDSLADAGDGRIGEIWVHGPSVAQGYWNRPDATADTFVEQEGRRWLRTGDLGFFHAGQLHIAGRRKDLIIVRGHNLYPQDIERAVEAEVEAVRKGRVAAFSVQGPQGEGIGVAAEVSRGLQKLVPPEALRHAVSQAVGAACGEPASVVVLLNPGGLPKTSSGKLQRSACRDGWRTGELDAYAVFEHGQRRDATGTPPPVSAAGLDDADAQALAAIWRDALGGNLPDARSNFFASGGNSLAAVQVAAAIAARWNIAASPRLVFDYPELAGCAARIRELAAVPQAREPGGAAPEGPVAAVARRDGAVPLSSAQLRQWFLWQLDRGSNAYHVGRALRLSGPLDGPGLGQAIQALIRRHEALRMRFRVLEDGTPVQQPIDLDAPSGDGAAPPSVVRLRDLRQGDPASARTQADAIVRLAFDTPFDLEGALPLRVELLRVDDEEHVLVLVAHHIVADAVSMRVLFEEIGALMAGRTLAPVPLAFADYAAWQRAQLEAGRWDAQRDDWVRSLGGEQPTLELATDRPRTAEGRYQAARCEVEIPPDLSARVQRAARNAQGSAFMQWLAAFQAVLYRYTGQTDVRVGVAAANRPLPALARTVGFFVNTQVLRGQVRGRMSLREVAAQARETVLDAQARQDYPFDGVVDAIAPERGVGRSPLFQVMMNHLHDDAGSPLALPGVEATALPLPEGAAQFELTLETREGRDGALAATLIYARELFDADTMRAFSKALVKVLRQLVDAPDVALDALDVLDEGVRDALLAAGTGAWTPRAFTPVHRLIEGHAAKTPQALALIAGADELSYAQLNERANRLAHLLIARGVGADVAVGIALGRGADMIVAMLAVLKAGGVYVPLDPGYPAARLAHMMQDSGLGLVLSQTSVVGRLTLPPGIRCVLVDGAAAAGAPGADLGRQPAHNPDRDIHPAQLAYLIYTSGSTGLPKGVAVSHGPLSMHIQAIGALYGMTPEDRELQFASINFDGAHERWLTPLAFGGVLIPRDDELWSVERSCAEIVRLGVTIACFTPSYLHQLAEAQGDAAAALPIRSYTVGGEATSRTTLALIQNTLRPPRVINGYGPTETVITPLIAKAYPDTPNEAAYMPIGQPVGDRRAYVLDADLNLLPPGAAGELYLGGDGLARGYLNRADLTAERFVADPFLGGGARMYRSGDLARWGKHGQIEYLGRVDHQVKIRGYRIELGEVETQLLAQPGVGQAVAVATGGHAGAARRLLAYVAPAAGTTVDADALRTSLARVLPDYMVPARVLVLPTLPLNAAGKVDRHALPEEPAREGASFAAPRPGLETALAAIWAKALGVKAVGRDDNFFELGGDSILTLKVVALARQAGLILSPKQLLQQQTLAALAPGVLLADDTADAAAPAEPATGAARLAPERLAQLPVPVEDIEDAYPLSPMQHGMLLHTLRNPNSGIYVMQDRYRVDGELDEDAFEWAWRRVLENHPALRATFHWQWTHDPVQVIRRTVALPVQRLDLRELGQEAAVAHYESLLNEELRTGLPLDQAPLLRLRVARVAEREYRWALSFHHMLMDAWCLSLLLTDFFDNYDARRAGQGPVRTPSRPHRDFIDWLQGRDIDAARHYWRDALAGFGAVTPLPGLRTETVGEVSSMVDLTSTLSESQTTQLQRVAQQCRVTPNTVIQAAWALTLARHAGQDEVLYGVTVAGRPTDMAQAQQTIGIFINTIPMRVRLPAGGSLPAAQWMRTLLDQNADMRAHEHLSLADVQGFSDVAPGQPLFDSLVVFENAPIAGSVFDRAGRMGLSSLGMRTHTNYPLTVVLLPGPRLALQLTYDTRRLDAQAVAGMLATFRANVEALIATPDAPVASLMAPPPAERDRLLAAGRGRQADYCFDAGYVRLFEAQAARRNGIAVRCGQDAVTYPELNRRANRIGQALIERGVGADDVVAVYCERGVDFIASALGAFKAGAAYLGLDVRLPPQRVASILSQSGAKVVLVGTAEAPLLDAALALVRNAPRVLWAEEALAGPARGRGQEPGNPGRHAHPDQAAYLIFTSGSTGEPKGVVVTHRGMLNNQLSKVPALGLDEHAVIGQTAAPSFDISVWQMLAGLLCGATVEVVPDDTARDPVALLRHAHARGITVLESVPTLIQGMLAVEPVALPALRWMLPTGEATPLSLARDWLRRYPGVPLVNAYGPAECADDVAFFTLRPGDQEPGPGLPIGTAADNTRLMVLDAELNPVPPGVVGEIYIAGVGVGRGYTRRPGLTAERFLPDLHGGGAGARMYRSGDLGRMRPDGVLEYAGRVDHQVKVRGYRVELGEIEARLAALPEVGEAAVQAVDDGNGTRLVGYVAPAPGWQPPEGAQAWREALRAALARDLPDYMIPGVWVRLDALPRNRNGKLDRKALPAPDLNETAREYVAPNDGLEAQLAQIWSEVLGVERVGRLDNFFELGGHSLMVMQVTARIQASLGRPAPINALFEHQTLAAFAGHLQHVGGAADAQALDALDAFMDTLENH